MAYEPNPETWPARVAEIVTRIRAFLSDQGAVVHPTTVFRDLRLEEGIIDTEGGYVESADRPELRSAELAFLLIEALNQLESRGEILRGHRPFPNLAELVRPLAEHLGWQEADRVTFEVAETYRPSVQLAMSETREWRTELTGWPNVLELLTQAQLAHRAQLDVAAAVTARVAVEEAVERALATFDPGGSWEGWKAARREAHLFRQHLAPRTAEHFEPIDRNATLFTLSDARDFGNTVAHSGSVTDALHQEALMLQLPRALASLARAVAALASQP